MLLCLIFVLHVWAALRSSFLQRYNEISIRILFWSNTSNSYESIAIVVFFILGGNQHMVIFTVWKETLCIILSYSVRFNAALQKSIQPKSRIIIYDSSEFEKHIPRNRKNEFVSNIGVVFIWSEWTYLVVAFGLSGQTHIIGNIHGARVWLRYVWQ